MSVTFVVCNKNVVVDYKNVVTSKIVQCLITDVESTIVNIPDCYVTVIDNYACYINNASQRITTKEQFKTCFKLANYLEDNNYFQSVLIQLFSAAHLRFSNWSSMSSFVYQIGEISNDLKYDILFRCPHDFLPPEYVNNMCFMKEWNRTNVNVVVTINSDSIYYINHTTMKHGCREVVNYHTVAGDNINGVEEQQEVGVKTITSFDKNNNICEHKEYKDGICHGTWKRWHVNNSSLSDNGYDNLECEITFVNDKRHGRYRGWYSNNENVSNLLHTQGYYHDGKKCGIWQHWHENGQLKYTGSFYNDEKYGQWKYWCHDGKLRYSQIYMTPKSICKYIYYTFLH